MASPFNDYNDYNDYDGTMTTAEVFGCEAWPELTWTEKADQLGNRCCAELERIAEKWRSK
jgi:hypothetical protein